MEIEKKFFLATGCCALSSWALGAELELVSQSPTDFRIMLFGFCAVVSVIVFSVLFYSTIYHRKSAYFFHSNFHKKLGAEVLWVLLPIVMLVGMAIPSAVNLIGPDELGEFKEQAYAVLSRDRQQEAPKISPKPL